MTENSSETAESKTLISLIRSSKNSKDALKSLKKLGFTEKNLEIWQERFLKKGVCAHE